jgi:hypothetical protein
MDRPTIQSREVDSYSLMRLSKICEEIQNVLTAIYYHAAGG